MPRSRKARPVDDDIDAITPCPLPPQEPPSPRTAAPPSPSPSLDLPSPVHSVLVVHDRLSHLEDAARLRSRSVSPSSECDAVMHAASSNNRRRDSVRALEEGTDGDPGRLWKRMLALQQIYGCYNSARMSAALSSGDASLLLREYTLLHLSSPARVIGITLFVILPIVSKASGKEK